HPPPPALFPYTTLFRSLLAAGAGRGGERAAGAHRGAGAVACAAVDQLLGGLTDVQPVEQIEPCEAVQAAEGELHSQVLERHRGRSEEHTSELQSLAYLV